MKLKPFILRIQEEPGYFLKFLKKKISSIFLKLSETPQFPRNISIVPTYRCDFSCIMCGNPKVLNTNLDDNRVNIETYKKLIDEIANYNCNIVLTGGEPLLYKNWYELSKYIKYKNLRLDLQTNGWELENSAEKIVDVIDNLNVSLDGPKEVHNKIRKLDSFERTISGLKKIDKIKKIKNRKKPYIVIIYTISDLNYSYLSQTIEYLEKLKIQIDTLLFIHQMFIPERVREECINNISKKFKISDVFLGFKYVPKKIDIEIISKEIERVKKISKNVSFNVSFLQDFKKEELAIYYSETEKFPSTAGKICKIPFTDAFILPSGDVWICPLNVVGNIREESFLKLWNCEKAKKFRIEIMEKKRFQICKNCCGLYG
jgi:MoaA/NifB/PqqE/SkfB family radical SAM enzyme